MDYHSYHENVPKIEAYLEVYGFLDGPVAGGDPDPEKLVSEMILTCTIKNYNTLTTPLERPMHPIDLGGVVEESLKQLQVELEHFSPVFRNHHPSPDAEYINILTKLISQDHAALDEEALSSINDDVMVCLKEMEAWDDFIREYAEGDYGETLMDGMDEIRPMLQHAGIQTEEDRYGAPISGLLWKWMYAQEENFEKFTQNILDLETWEPITEGVHHSSSVTDMFAMFRQTMDFFFRMELGVPEFLTHLLDSIVGCLMQYANLMKRHQPSKGSEPVELSTMQESLVSHLPAIAQPVRVKDHDEIPEQEKAAFLSIGPRQGGNVEMPDPPTVCVRMCNVYNTLKQFKAFVEDVTERFTELLQSSRTYRGVMPESAQAQLDSYTKGIETTFEDALFELQELLGVMIVFGEDGLRRNLMQLSYTPTPRANGLEASIVELEEMIDALKDLVEPELVEDIVGGVKHSFLMGFERVLLDGGVHRVFDACDAEIFRRDLSLLIAFFGQEAAAPMSVNNIPTGVTVTEPCVRCEQERACVFCTECNKNYCNTCDAEIHGGAWESHRRHVYHLNKKVRSLIEVIDVLALPTEELLQLYEDPQVAVGMGGAFAHKRCDPLELLTKVLVHRDDDDAIAFGKKHIEGYETGGVTRVGDSVTKAGTETVKGVRSVGHGLMKGTRIAAKGTAYLATAGRYRGADSDDGEEAEEAGDDALGEGMAGGAEGGGAADGEGDLRIDVDSAKQSLRGVFGRGETTRKFPLAEMLADVFVRVAGVAGAKKLGELARDSMADGSQDDDHTARAAAVRPHIRGHCRSNLCLTMFAASGRRWPLRRRLAGAGGCLGGFVEGDNTSLLCHNTAPNRKALELGHHPRLLAAASLAEIGLGLADEGGSGDPHLRVAPRLGVALGLVVQALAEGVGVSVVQVGLDALERDRCAVGERGRHLHHLLHHLLGRVERVAHEPEVLGLDAREHFGHEVELAGLARAHDARQGPGAAEVSGEADVDEGRGELCLLGGEAKVGGACPAEAGARARAVDGGDRDLVHVAQQLRGVHVGAQAPDAGVHGGGARLALWALGRVRGAGHALDVAAGAEAAAGAGQDDDAQVRVARRHGERGAGALDEVRCHGVEALRPVEGDRACGAHAVEQHAHGRGAEQRGAGDGAARGREADRWCRSGRRRTAPTCRCCRSRTRRRRSPARR